MEERSEVIGKGRVGGSRRGGEIRAGGKGRVGFMISRRYAAHRKKPGKCQQKQKNQFIPSFQFPSKVREQRTWQTRLTATLQYLETNTFSKN
jgi:hypothetical protein